MIWVHDSVWIPVLTDRTLPQVPLDEIPGALAKCASASTASWSASIRSKSDPSGLQLALPSAAVVSAWREQFKGADALNSSRLNEDRVVFDAQGPWTALQYAFATAAAAHVATAMPSTLERFASRIIELRIPQDHPVVASAAVALQDALIGSTAGEFMHPRLFDADMPFKLLARLAQTLAWAGLATSDSMSALSCEAALQLRSDPPRSAMMLADGALQFANAGVPAASHRRMRARNHAFLDRSLLNVLGCHCFESRLRQYGVGNAPDLGYVTSVMVGNARDSSCRLPQRRAVCKVCARTCRVQESATRASSICCENRRQVCGCWHL